MTTSHALTFQFPRAAARTAAGVTHTVAPGTAIRLAPRAPMALRIAEGQAWITLGQGVATNDDLVLCAGQTLQVAVGQRVVVEPLGDRRLQYRLTRQEAGAGAASWWRRASLSNGATAHVGPDDACCA